MSERTSTWNLLHDGVISRIERSNDMALLWIEADFLRERFSPAGRGFSVELSGCTLLSYTPYEEMTIDDPSQIAAAAPDILEATEENEALLLWSSKGCLRTQYQTLRLFLDRAREVSVEELTAVVATYWADWSHH